MAKIGSGLIRIDVSWTSFKSTVSSKNLTIQYEETATAYEIFSLDGNIIYYVLIFKVTVPNASYNQVQNDLDKTDFETNYKDIVTNRVVSPPAAVDGSAANSTNPTLIAASDGSIVRTVRSDSSGRLIMIGQGVAGTPAGGVLSIQGVSGGTAITVSGTVTAANASVSTTGSTPPASATYIGGSVTTAAPSYTTGQISALSLTTGGLLRTDGSGTTQPVSGTVSATQSGTWTVQPGNTANTIPWLTTINQGGNSATVTGANALKVDGSAVTQPVSGTVTANVGTTNGLALDVTLAKLTIAQSTALGSSTQALVGGSVTTAAPTYTTGNINPLSLTTSGALRVDGSGTTQPISAASLPLPTGAATETTLGTRLADSTFIGRINTLGQKTSANSTPVVLATDQSTIAVTGTVTATNPSVSATAASPPSSATYIGGSVTTAAPTYTTGQLNALSLTTGGLLRTDGSGATQPVSGTVAATQSGTWTVQPGNTANTTPWLATINQGGNSATVTGLNALKVDGSAVTQPVSGTVTANIGTTNGLALDASVNGILLTQGSTTSGQKGNLVQGAVTTAAPSYTTAQTSPLSLTTAGALRTDSSATTQPVSGTVTANAGTGNFTVVQSTAANLRSQTASESATGSTTPATAGLAGGTVTTAAPTYTTGNLGALSLTTSGLLRVDGSGTTQPVSGTVTSNIGTTNGLALDTTLTAHSVADNAAFTDGTTRVQPVGFIFDEVAGTSLTENDAAAARIDNKRAQILVIEDGSTRGTRATVKAASTAAVASDPALVVAISPNNAITVTNPSVSTTGSAPPGSATYIGGSVTTAAPSYTTGQMSALSLTTVGALRVDGSAVTQPVSAASLPLPAGAATESTLATILTLSGFQSRINTLGQKTMASSTPVVLSSDQSAIPTSQSGSWTVTANAGSGTFAVSAASLPLPSGAATETSLAKLTLTQGSTTSGQSGTLYLGAVTTTAPTYTNGQSSPLSLDTSGALRITGSISASNPSVSTTGTTPPASATYIGGSVTTAAPSYTNGQMSALSLTTTGLLRVDGSGVTQPVSGTITANIGTTNGLALDASITAQSLVDNGAFTDGTTRVQPVGYIFDEVAGTALTENDAAAARIDSKRAQINVIEDGTTRGTRATVKAASTAAVAGDTSFVVALSPNSPVPTGSNTIGIVNQGTSASLANAWSTKITDATNGPVAVKAASTAAIATDPALVVAVSPNNTLPVQVADVTATGTLNALNANVQITLAGRETAGFQLAAGTLIGTILAEVSFNGGTTWNSTYIDNTGGNKVSSIVFSSSNTATSSTIIGVGGAGLARIIVSAFTSGTANITLRASNVSDPSILFGGTPGSTTQPPVGAQIAGYDSAGVLRVPSVKAASTAPGVSDQALVVVLSPNQPAIPVTTAPTTSTPNLSVGVIVLSSVTTSSIRKTTYTQQTSNFTGSIASASANDTSAGTGARTVRIFWVNSTGTTNGTEDVTLNGTTGVNLVTTTICHIEKIEVLTAGSGLVNAGIISLYTGVNKTGTVVGSIAAGDNATFWAHHYVITGKTCNVTGIYHGNSSTVSGGTSVSVLRTKSLTGSNDVERQVSDFISVAGAANPFTRIYGSVIRVAGPVVLTMYVTTSSSTTINYRGSFDSYDE